MLEVQLKHETHSICRKRATPGETFDMHARLTVTSSSCRVEVLKRAIAGSVRLGLGFRDIQRALYGATTFNFVGFHVSGFLSSDALAPFWWPGGNLADSSPLNPLDSMGITRGTHQAQAYPDSTRRLE